MKKFICITLVVLILGAGAWVILFRPSKITDKTVREDFEGMRSSFETVAEYLTKNNVNTEINGFLTPSENYGVPNTNEDDYKKFNNELVKIMEKDVDSIVSDGKSVEFRYRESGGVLSRKEVSLICNGKQSVDGRPTESLGDGWHLYIG